MLAKGLRDDGRSMSTVPGRRAPDHVAAVPLMEIRWRTLIFVFRAPWCDAVLMRLSTVISNT